MRPGVAFPIDYLWGECNGRSSTGHVGNVDPQDSRTIAYAWARHREEAARENRRCASRRRGFAVSRAPAPARARARERGMGRVREQKTSPLLSTHVSWAQTAWA